MLKISNLNKPHNPKETWPEEKRIEAVTMYLTVNNLRIVSGATGVPYSLLRLWKTKPWWKEFEYEIKNAKRAETNTKLTKIIDKSLTLIEDRLENGDVMINMKTGELIRKPVQLRDISKLTNDLMTRQEKLDQVKVDESQLLQKETMQDTLRMLAEEFAKLNGTRKREVIDVTDVTVKDEDDAVHEEWETGLQEGEREVQLSSGSSEEESGEERSTEAAIQRGLSPQGGW